MKTMYFLLLLGMVTHAAAQVGINTTSTPPDHSAMLDIKSTTRGLLIPRLTLAQRNAMVTPATGLMIFQTDNTTGFYYNSGTPASPVWSMVGMGTGWGLTGNAGTSAAIHFVGTTDNVPLTFRVGNQHAGEIDQVMFNVGLGYGVLWSNTSGTANTAMGHRALTANTTGINNTGIGQRTLSTNTSGEYNVALGYQSLYYNTTGKNNVAVGAHALTFNTSGFSNVAMGMKALYHNTERSNLVAVGDSALYNNGMGAPGPEYARHNTAVGSKSLFSNTIGSTNTAIGAKSLYSNTSGSENTATGYNALYSNTTGMSNTANGHSALFSNTVGFNNSALGFSSLNQNTTGYDNTAIGYLSLSDNTIGTSNTAVGSNALRYNTTGTENSALGYGALYKNISGKGNVAIGLSALSRNETGDKNTSIGYRSLAWNTGWDNTATGYQALLANTSGFDNVAIGVDALAANTTGNGNTAVGKGTMKVHITGNNNTAVGFNANIANGITNATAIGYQATVTVSDKIVLGNASATTVGGYGNWSNYSDKRLKENIVYTSELGLNFISQLKTASFNYTGDENKRRRDGLIAQDVAQTLKELGIPFSGLIIDNDAEKTMNLSYSDLVIPLINAVKELQQRLEQLEAAAKK